MSLLEVGLLSILSIDLMVESQLFSIMIKLCVSHIKNSEFLVYHPEQLLQNKVIQKTKLVLTSLPR